MFDVEEKAFLAKLTKGMTAEMRNLRAELGALREELDEVERIMTCHIQAGGQGKRSCRGLATVVVPDESRRIPNKHP